MEQQSKRHKIQEWADRATTYLSTDDIQEMEEEPDSCLGTYFGTLNNLIKKDIRLLIVLFGQGCAHLAEVQGVHQILSTKSAVYETMTAELVAEILVRYVFIGLHASPSSCHHPRHPILSG